MFLQAFARPAAARIMNGAGGAHSLLSPLARSRQTFLLRQPQRLKSSKSGGQDTRQPPPPPKKQVRMAPGREGKSSGARGVGKRPPPGGGESGNTRRAPGGAGRRAGAEPAKAKGLPWGLIGGGAMAGCVGWWYSSLDEEGNVTGPLKLVGDFFDKQAANIMGLDGKPSREKLLPEIQPHMRYPDGQAPLTLVLAFEDTLVHTTWDRRNGFRVAKRPGVDKFLECVSSYYEVVFWTELAGAVGQDVVFSLDRQRGYYHHELHQDAACAMGRKEFVKDLSYLNRDPSRVIVIDSNPKNLRRQPENLCQVRPFVDPEGQTDDTDLTDLIPFLQQLAIQQMGNREALPKILARYGNTDVGAKYKKKIEEMAEQSRLKGSQGFMGAMKKRRGM